MEKLSEYGLPRKPNESFVLWVARVQQQHHVDITALTQMFHLHQRLRFDPEGLKSDEQQQLLQLTDQWLVAQGSIQPTGTSSADVNGHSTL